MTCAPIIPARKCTNATPMVCVPCPHLDFLLHLPIRSADMAVHSQIFCMGQPQFHRCRHALMRGSLRRATLAAHQYFLPGCHALAKGFEPCRDIRRRQDGGRARVKHHDQGAAWGLCSLSIKLDRLCRLNDLCGWRDSCGSIELARALQLARHCSTRIALAYASWSMVMACMHAAAC